MKPSKHPRSRRTHGAATAALFVAGVLTATLALPSAGHAGSLSSGAGTIATAAAIGGDKGRGAPNDADARRLLKRMLEAESQVAFAAREVTFLAGGRQSEQIVKHDPRRGERKEFVQPAGLLLVDNFRKSWLLSDRDRHLVESASRLNELRRAVRRVLGEISRGDVSAQTVGEDRVAGRVADIVRVSPGGSGLGGRRFWIDRETGLRLKTEEVGPRGRVISSSYFLEIDLRPRFSDADFAPPSLPRGFRRFVLGQREFRNIEDAQREVAFDVRKPAYVPPGFVLRQVSVSQVDNNKVVVQRYSNGMNNLTLVQTDAALPMPPARGGESRGGNDRAGAVGRRPMRPFMWRAGDLSFALVGNVAQDELRRIAASVR